MSFPKGNRIRAGSRKQQFTEDELRRLLVLPAVRAFYVFRKFHRDRIRATELAEQTGMSLQYLYQMIWQARAAIGLQRRPIELPEADSPRWTFDEGLRTRPELDARNNFYLWSDAVEQAARQYFLAPALERCEIARLLFVEHLSWTEVGRKLDIAPHKAANLARAVYKIAAGKKRQVVLRGGRDGSLQSRGSRSSGNSEAECRD